MTIKELLSEVKEGVKWHDAYYLNDSKFQHSKLEDDISALIEIIKLQNEALDKFKEWSAATESQAKVTELLQNIVGRHYKPDADKETI